MEGRRGGKPRLTRRSSRGRTRSGTWRVNGHATPGESQGRGPVEVRYRAPTRVRSGGPSLRPTLAPFGIPVPVLGCDTEGGSVHSGVPADPTPLPVRSVEERPRTGAYADFG
jgi:hypothetical protein